MTPTDAVSRPKTAKTPTKKRLSGGQDEAEDIMTCTGMRVIPKQQASRRGRGGRECAGIKQGL